MDLTEGIKALALGVPTVFLVLILISGVISLLQHINFEKKPAPEPKEIADLVPIVAKQKEDLELVAVITASIAASLNTTTDQLEIISFREINKETRGSWKVRY